MRRLLPFLLALALLAGCSDDDPPEWLVDRAASSTTTAPTTTAVTTTTAPAPGRELAAIELQARQCIEDAATFTSREVNEVSRVQVVPCRLPHGAEVYLRDAIAAGPNAAFPGVGRLRGQAQDICRQRFERFVGIPWTRSELEIAALWPSPDSWSDGDRLVVCTVFRVDGAPLTGTARGSQI